MITGEHAAFHDGRGFRVEQDDEAIDSNCRPEWEVEQVQNGDDDAADTRPGGVIEQPPAHDQARQADHEEEAADKEAHTTNKGASRGGIIASGCGNCRSTEKKDYQKERTYNDRKN